MHCLKPLELGTTALALVMMFAPTESFADFWGRKETVAPPAPVQVTNISTGTVEVPWELETRTVVRGAAGAEYDLCDNAGWIGEINAANEITPISPAGFLRGVKLAAKTIGAEGKKYEDIIDAGVNLKGNYMTFVKGSIEADVKLHVSITDTSYCGYGRDDIPVQKLVKIKVPAGKKIGWIYRVVATSITSNKFVKANASVGVNGLVFGADSAVYYSNTKESHSTIMGAAVIIINDLVATCGDDGAVCTNSLIAANSIMRASQSLRALHLPD